jgi:carbamoyltransferase
MHLGIVPANDGSHHDPSACLVERGEVRAFVEQERMSRDKHAEGQFPLEAIEEVLSIASISIRDVSTISLSRNYDNRRKALGRLARRGYNSTTSGCFERLYDTVMLPLKQSTQLTNEKLRSLTALKLSTHFDIDQSELPEIRCRNHQHTHATSAFLPSGFDEALVVSLDNYGGHLSGGVYHGEGSQLRMLESFPRFNSLGRFFGDFTAFLGFRRSNGEGKVMGLAPYGEPNEHIGSVVESYYTVDDGHYDVEALTYRKPSDAVAKLERDLGFDQRYWRDEIEQRHKDVAFHLQRVVEDIVSQLSEFYLEREGLSKVCLAGGVALNCKMNKRIRELDAVEDMFVQPAANDAGGALGAAYIDSVEAGDSIAEMHHPYFGTAYTTEEVTAVCDELKVDYDVVDDPPERAAERLADGELVGWFQGGMEGGPRALGNRSILADPRSPDSLDRVNRYVKHREEWRPFAPSMLRSAGEQYLEGELSKAARFMIDTYETTAAARESIPATLHPADDTTRPQIVTADANPRYHSLISAFEDRTGVGAVLNTSFNDSGEPMVRSPQEAIRDFYSMGLDVLFVEDVMIEK